MSLFTRALLALALVSLQTYSVFAQEGGDMFRILNAEYNAINARNNLLLQAKREILFSTFIIKSDAIGHAKLKELTDAAARGVKVKMLLDDLGNKVPYELLLYVQEKGVQVRIFNKKNWWRPHTVVRRMHGKMLIVDSTYLLVGGRNVDNEYFRMDTVSNFLDREVLISSDRAVGNAHQHFMAMWLHEGVSHKLEGALTTAQRIACAAALDTALAAVNRQLPMLRAMRAPDTINTLDAMRPTVGKVNFIHANFASKKNGQLQRARKNDRRVTDELIELINSANQTIDFEAAYFLPTRRWRKAISAAIERGVKVRVFTNSDQSNDVPLIQAIYANKRKRFQRMGIELYEYCGERMVHTKAITIDDRIAVIGSYNIEQKSERFNTEVMAWVNDPHHAGLQKGILERNLLKCKRPGGVCPSTVAAPNKQQMQRAKKVKRLRWTLAPIADIVF